MRYAVAIVLAGCSFEPGGLGGTDPLGDGGPDSGSTSDAAGGDASSTDLDNDGVPNSSDNCPTVPNPGQYNEDMDATGDACDPCPQIPAEPASDTDGDGIADLCDPHVLSADVRVVFEGFNGTAIPSGWTRFGSGTHTVQAGSLQVTSGGSNDFLQIPTTASRHVIEIGYSVTSATGSGCGPGLWGLTDLASDRSTFYLCGTRFDTQERELWAYRSAWSKLDASGATLPTPSEYNVRAINEAIGPRCYVSKGVDVASLSATQAAADSTQVGIMSCNVQATVHYAIVYTF